MALLDFNGSPHGGRQRHLPEWQSQPKITPTTIIDHSIVGSAEGAWQMFATRSVLESHFIVGLTGEVWQLMDTGRQADANLNANGYAISIETADLGDPDNQPWTAAQLRSLQWLHEAIRAAHPTIPRRESRSCADPAGLGYHVLHGAPSCWTPVAKTCPGRVRIRQWREQLLPAFLAGQALEDDMPLNDDDKAWIAARLEESERRVARYVDHGDAAVTGSGNHHVRVREDLAALRAILEAGLSVTLGPDQLRTLADTLAPMVAELLAGAHPTLTITGVAAPEPPA
jgi:N-acetylmuramoyl-L-alanine amidase